MNSMLLIKTNVGHLYIKKKTELIDIYQKNPEYSRGYYSQATLSAILGKFWAETGKMLFHKNCRKFSEIFSDIKIRKIGVHMKKL